MNTKKKIVSLLFFLIVICSLLLLFIIQKNSLESAPDKFVTESSLAVSEIPISSEQPIAVSADTEIAQIPVNVNDASTRDISSWMSSLINDSYKTTFFACDIISQEEKDGVIISLQLDSADFSNRERCISAIKDIIIKALPSDFYKDIDSFDFSMTVNSRIRYVILIDDAQEITSADTIENHMIIHEF